MSNVPAPVRRRVEQLESNQAELQALIRELSERDIVSAHPRQIRLAKTWSSSGGSYPTAPADTYEIIFRDGSFTETVGDQTPTWVDRSATGQTFAHNATSTALIPRFNPVVVMESNGQWWIVYGGAAGWTLDGTSGSEAVAAGATVTLKGLSTDLGNLQVDVSPDGAPNVKGEIKMPWMLARGLATADWTASDTVLTDDATNTMDGVVALVGALVSATLSPGTVLNTIGASGSNNDVIFIVRDHTAGKWEIIEAPPTTGEGDTLWGFQLTGNMTSGSAAADKKNLDATWTDAADSITILDPQDLAIGALTDSFGICVQPGGTGTIYHVIYMIQRAKRVKVSVDNASGFSTTDATVAVTQLDFWDGDDPSVTVVSNVQEDPVDGTDYLYSGVDNLVMFASYDEIENVYKIDEIPGTRTLAGDSGSEVIDPRAKVTIKGLSTDKGALSVAVAPDTLPDLKAEIGMPWMLARGKATADWTASDTVLTDDATNTMDGVVALVGALVSATLAPGTVKNTIGSEGSNNDDIFIVYDHTNSVWEIIEAPPTTGTGDVLWGFSLNEDMGATTTGQASADKLNLNSTWSDTTLDITVSDVKDDEAGALNGEFGICVQPGGTGTFFQILQIYRKARTVRFSINVVGGFKRNASSVTGKIEDSFDGVAPGAVGDAITLWNPDAEPTGGGTFYRFSGADKAEGTALYHPDEDKYYIESLEPPDVAGGMVQGASSAFDATAGFTKVPMSSAGLVSRQPCTDLTADDFTEVTTGWYCYTANVRFVWNDAAAVVGTTYGAKIGLKSSGGGIIAASEVAVRLDHQTSGSFLEASATIALTVFIVRGGSHHLAMHAELKCDIISAHLGAHRICSEGKN